MKIAIDMDDVTVDFMNALAKFHNDMYGTSLAKKDYFSYHLGKVWKCTYEEAFEKVRLFTESAYFDSMKPMEGAVEGIRFLKKENDIIVVTSRFIPKEKTFIQLDRYVPGVFPENKVHFSYNYYTGIGNRKKAEICLDEKVDMMIEDSAEYANECASNGIKTLLFNQPWNENEKLHRSVERVHSWKEIMQKRFSV